MADRVPGKTYAELGLTLAGTRERGGAPMAKGLSPDMQAWVTGMDMPDSVQGAQLVSPYQQSAWIYIAVSVLAESVAQIPFRISRLNSADARRVRTLRDSTNPKQRDFCRRALAENIIDSGDVVDLFNAPHPTMDRTLFWEQIISWDCLRGEFFIVPLDGADEPVDLAERNPRVSRMLTLTPDLFWHMVIGYELTAWRFTGSPLLTPMPSEVLLPTEVIHSRSYNPYLYWRGMSPLLVAMLPASADYAAEMFQKGLLMNNADTGIIATTEQTLTQEQRDQFTAALRERKRKAGTPDRPLFLSSGVTIEKPTISNVDMQFLETRRLLRQEIGAIFKVPESMMGFSEAKSSSLSGGGNALNEEKLTFIEQCLTPKCRRCEAAVAPIVKSFDPGLVGWFDIEGLPIMQDARRSRVETAVKVFALGVPFNVLNSVYDLGFPKLAWGDKGFLPFNLQPADAMEAPAPAEDEPPKPSGNDAETPIAGFRKLLGSMMGEAAQAKAPDTRLLWQAHMRARAGMVKVFERKTVKVLFEYRAKALAKLSHIHLEALRAGQLPSAQPPDGVPIQRGLVDLIFNAGEFGHSLKLVVEKPQREAYQEAGQAATQEVGVTDPWSAPPKEVGEFIRSREQSIMGVGGTVRDQLNTSLEAGFSAGETTDQLAERIRSVFSGLSKGEATRVARTETNITFNTARDSAFADAGIEYKSWLSSHGPRVRPGHEEAEETYADNPIPMSEPFIVDLDGEGEQLMFPGDDSLGASVGNIVNCQCVQLAATKQEEDEKGAWYFIFGAGLRYFAKAGSSRSINHHHCEMIP